MSDSIYTCKDGRMRVYVKETKKVMSYPKYLMECELGRPLSPNEEVHHKDENPLNNSLDNLEIRIHGEHQAEHSVKYHDTVVSCAWCGKEFLWTGKQQRTFYGNRRYDRSYSEKPFCSRQCSGHYGRQKQLDSYKDNTQTPHRSSQRKLSEEQVLYIREHYIPFDNEYGARALASTFGVDKSVVSLIVQGKTYKDFM